MPSFLFRNFLLRRAPVFPYCGGPSSTNRSASRRGIRVIGIHKKMATAVQYSSWTSIPKRDRKYRTNLHYTDDEQPPPLVEIVNADLSYSKSADPMTNGLRGICLRIENPTHGGHVLLGKNSSGKSLISNTIRARGDPTYVNEGSFRVDRLHRIAHVSFESHEELLKEGGTAYKAIAQGNLSKAAQFLVVRFGLYPLLYRPVDTLSTGEIRKVMLVRALASRPKLLVLDNAFDGLDVPSREALKDLVSRTLKGFRPDILVQAVSARDTAHTQVLMSTHRAEEIVPEISTVSVLSSDGLLVTKSRENRTEQELLSEALGLDSEDSEEPWNNESLGLPSVDTIRSWISSSGSKAQASHGSMLVEAEGVSVRKGDATLIKKLTWNVSSGESWLVAGHNGSGKSTLSRMLAREEPGMDEGVLKVLGSSVRSVSKIGQQRLGIGWVSTELHMAEARSQDTALEVVSSKGQVDTSSAKVVAQWLKVGSADILSRRFSDLSQGQQKLILIASALALRPSILILDEPCQGLDLINRSRVLGLVERFCRAACVSLIYITHHYEEVIPSVSNVLHLKGGIDVYNGPRTGYDPSIINLENE